MLEHAGGGDLAQRLDPGLVDRALVDVEACSLARRAGATRSLTGVTPSTPSVSAPISTANALR